MGEFLSRTPGDQLYLTDFALHSVGIVLARLGRPDAYVQFIRDTLLEGGVSVVRLGPHDLQAVVWVMERYGLDFDDAYQYQAAEAHGLQLVSFDSDFDRAPLGRQTPSQALQGR